MQTKETINFYKPMILAFLFVIILAGFFYLGAILSCNHSGGTLSRFTCVNINVIDVCEYKGDYYIMNRTPRNLTYFEGG